MKTVGQIALNEVTLERAYRNGEIHGALPPRCGFREVMNEYGEYEYLSVDMPFQECQTLAAVLAGIGVYFVEVRDRSCDYCTMITTADASLDVYGTLTLRRHGPRRVIAVSNSMREAQVRRYGQEQVIEYDAAA